jgi:hypothetical protein
MEATRTTFGTVSRDAHGTRVSGTGTELRDWANRGGCRWPLSILAQLDAVTATFDTRGDLVDLTGDDDVDLTGDELGAWTSECLIRAGYPNHPAIR